jgi:hypothetical protein
MDGAQITDPKDRYAYMLGGDAKVTIVSKRSGARFTYRITKKDLEDGRFLHFVKVLQGPDNTSDYMYLGTIFGGQQYRHGAKSPIGPDAPSAKAFAWVWYHLDSQDIEIWHSGECSRCGRELTDPESIARGLGPVCAEKSYGG